MGDSVNEELFTTARPGVVEGSHLIEDLARVQALVALRKPIPVRLVFRPELLGRVMDSLRRYVSDVSLEGPNSPINSLPIGPADHLRDEMFRWPRETIGKVIYSDGSEVHMTMEPPTKSEG